MLYLEDLVPGARYELGTTTVDEEEMIGFALRYDPQPFHVDRRAAEAGPFGGIIASGWYTCALFMRQMVDAVLSQAAGMGSPGVYDIAWTEPVRGGDRLSATLTVKETRPSAKHPGRGSALMLGELFRLEEGEGASPLVMKATFRGLFARRPASAV